MTPSLPPVAPFCSSSICSTPIFSPHSLRPKVGTEVGVGEVCTREGAPNSQHLLFPSPCHHSPLSWPRHPPRLDECGTGGCDVAGGAQPSAGGPGAAPGLKPEEGGRSVPVPRSPGALLGVWRSFRTGLAVAKQTQYIARLLRLPAAVSVLWCPAGSHPVLGPGVRDR